jgi:Flp pilus assembly pilin Flp
MERIKRLVLETLRGRRGISSVEYALLLAVIGSGIVVAAGTLTDAVSDEMTEAARCIDGTSEACSTTD